MTNIVARRQANEVRFTFVLPNRNQDGSQPIDLERVEVFAATVAAGAMVPSNRELMTLVHRTGSIDVKPPPPKEGSDEEKKAAALPKKDDPRPGPGDTVTFSEELTEARLKPAYTKPAPAEASPAPGTTTKPAETPKPGETPEATTKPPVPQAAPIPKRIYSIRGVARGGRPGPPSIRFEIPLTDPPPVAGGVAASFTESGVALTWLPPVP
jgi:hypothetical protein